MAGSEVREAVDLILSGHFNFEEPGIFEPVREALFDRGDPYMHLADMRSYLDAHDQVDALHRRPDEWTRKAILNVAHVGRFSSDRAVAEYARDIWRVEPCPVEPVTEADAPEPAAGPSPLACARG